MSRGWKWISLFSHDLSYKMAFILQNAYYKMQHTKCRMGSLFYSVAVSLSLLIQLKNPMMRPVFTILILMAMLACNQNPGSPEGAEVLMT